jgi:hypothetical protein
MTINLNIFLSLGETIQNRLHKPARLM